MNKLVGIFAVFAASSFNSAVSAPYVFETGNATVFVSSPLGYWSPDAGLLGDTAKSLTNKTVSYRVFSPDGRQLRGSPVVFQGMSDSTITNGVKTALDSVGYKLVSNDAYNFTVMPFVSIDSDQMQALSESQSVIYKSQAISSGDPQTQTTWLTLKKIGGGALSFAALLTSMDKFGALPGAQAALGSGITDDVYRFAYQNRSIIAPVELPKIDWKAFSIVDVRRVHFQPDLVGQIIVGWKGEKSDSVETDALINAIVYLTGAKTSPEEVAASRSADLARRKSLWDQCVAEKNC